MLAREAGEVVVVEAVGDAPGNTGAAAELALVAVVTVVVLWVAGLIVDMGGVVEGTLVDAELELEALLELSAGEITAGLVVVVKVRPVKLGIMLIFGGSDKDSTTEISLLELETSWDT